MVSVSFGREKFALRHCVIAKARNNSPCALKTPQIWCFVLVGRVFRGIAARGAVLGEFFRACWRSGRVYVLPAPSTPPVVGGLHDTRSSHSVSPACWTLMSCNSPNRVAVRSALEVV